MSAVLQDLKKYANKLVDSGLVVGAGGNLSMRDGEYMYISPSGFDLKETYDKDWVKVNIATGEILSELKPSSEILMRLECFRRNSEIEAVLHAHPTYSIAVSSTRQEIPAMFPTKGEMAVTICRINVVKGLGPVLQIAEGYTVDLPEDVHKTLDKRTDPTWPTTWFVPKLTGEGAFKDVYSVMNNWGANHCSMSYGHIGADLISLAAILRIPVNMHNVPEESIFGPDAWSMFGTSDKEAADYRACENFGPLYK